MYFAAASYLTFRHSSSDNIKIINGNTAKFYSTEFMAFYRRKTSQPHYCTHSEEGQKLLIFVKVIEINGRRDHLLAKGHVRPAILPVPQPQSWQA